MAALLAGHIVILHLAGKSLFKNLLFFGIRIGGQQEIPILQPGFEIFGQFAHFEHSGIFAVKVTHLNALNALQQPVVGLGLKFGQLNQRAKGFFVDQAGYPYIPNAHALFKLVIINSGISYVVVVDIFPDVMKVPIVNRVKGDTT